MHEAIAGYVEQLRSNGAAPPEAPAQVGTVEVELVVA